MASAALTSCFEKTVTRPLTVVSFTTMTPAFSERYCSTSSINAPREVEGELGCRQDKRRDNSRRFLHGMVDAIIVAFCTGTTGGGTVT